MGEMTDKEKLGIAAILLGMHMGIADDAESMGYYFENGNVPDVEGYDRLSGMIPEPVKEAVYDGDGSLEYILSKHLAELFAFVTEEESSGSNLRS